MLRANAKYFMAANSAEGFISCFDRCYDPAAGWRTYIIKGGPGTGKSSFMRKLIGRAAKEGVTAEEIYCASDPNSLDGVIFADLKTVVLDGTAPHVVEPRCPGACETLLDFGRFWDEGKLIAERKNICELSFKNKEFHKRVGRLISAAGWLLEDELAEGATSKDEIKETADMLAEKYFSEKGGQGREWLRFSRGITPKGLLRITERGSFENTATVEGAPAFVSGVIDALKASALERGYDTVTLLDPILPSKLTDGIVIPELSLYVCGRERPLDDKMGRLTESASTLLKKAKNNHDELEKYYIEAMDFEALNRFCDRATEKIFADAYR